jgi:hypothetical protein
METTTMLVEPIHVATIRGHQLRFFKTPNNDGRPDMPWHSHDDLIKCVGLGRNERRMMLRMCQKGPLKNAFRSVATAEGVVVIAPHYVARALLECMGEKTPEVLRDVDTAYCMAGGEALKKLTGDMPFEAFIPWTKAALDRLPGADP